MRRLGRGLLGLLLGAVLIVLGGDLALYLYYRAPSLTCAAQRPLTVEWRGGLGTHRSWLETPNEGMPAETRYRVVDLTTGRAYRWDAWVAPSVIQFYLPTRWTLFPSNWQWLYHRWALEYDCTL